MNYKNFTKIRNLKNLINYNSLSGSKSNMFQYCKNNGWIHEETKFKVFHELIKRNFEVFTEVEFKDKNRADIVAFDEKGRGFIFEIINSESLESINNKINKYNIDFELFFIYANKPIEEQLII
jgi:hypothetical protein